ncbi:uncharacterized protein LOC119734968 [Patiria miniata]|uniref:Uncharacterized protein n=1 Tax=Patiria miniata TaxID=46514 RepID=A0A914AM13_PATMI|nr:uncharacterized protein LOC119734968 [Patiria miniata]
MKVSMTTVTMAITLLLISTTTTGIPLKSSRSETTSDERLFGTTDRQTLRAHSRTQPNEQMTTEQAMRKILLYINSGRNSSVSQSAEKQRTNLHLSDSFTENEKTHTHVPTRIRRTSRCRRQTGDELMELLQSMGQINTRYADKSHQGFTSLIPHHKNEELDRLTKLEIEAVLRGNQSLGESLSHPHIQAIRASLVTPEEVNVPRVRRSVVGTTVSNYCVRSGQETNQGFIRMCDSCAATTELSDDLFPRYINEVVCSSNTECLSGGGRCSERTLSLTVLRRTGHCSVASSTSPSGQVMYVEDWEPTVQQIRVACECDISVQSVFAPYV